MSDNVVIPQSGGGDNVGNFSSSVANTSAVTANATGAASNGVSAVANSNDSSAIYGAHTNGGIGVFGRGGPNGGEGVFGQTTSNSSAVYGKNTSGPGVTGESAQGYGISGGGGDIGVYAHNLTTPANVVYLATRALAGDFQGNVRVSGDVILTGADCAEEFDIAETVDIEPGTVMVLDQDGALHQSQQAYDKRVAGVISGAGDYKPGLILDRRQSQDNRLPVALVGKVYCKVDAQYAPIEVGDLLTTSPTPGHAMKANEQTRAFGSVIGKALRSLETGRGLVPILIALQ
jgi:hypothetical protein